LLLSLLEVRWEHILEDLVGHKSVLELNHQSLLVFDGWVLDHLGVKVVEIDISDPNGKIVLSGNLFGGISSLLLEE